jgi:uncharacterized protein (UPF0276 family)
MIDHKANQLIGIGLRAPHYQEVIEKRPNIGWFEVHSENFFNLGGPTLSTLKAIREHYPISLHGVGLSLGSSSPIDKKHLEKLKILIKYIDPFLISEHLSWGEIQGIHLPDLLPVPYTLDSLHCLAQNIMIAQDYLKRELLIENPSSYLEYKESEFAEENFLVKLCKKTGAKILLDINNIFVSCSNHGWDAKKYIDAIPPALVKEIHLAGHSTKIISETQILKIDTHDDKVGEEVWALYQYALTKFGLIPTLIEWDAKIPEFEILLAEAVKAKNYCIQAHKKHIKHEQA